MEWRLVTPAFDAGDFLAFQLESGFGLMRVLAVDDEERSPIWHLAVYDEFFPEVAAAEKAIEAEGALHFRIPHMALTDRAFERTPAARIANRPLSEQELSGYRGWLGSREQQVTDRSALLMLGIR